MGKIVLKSNYIYLNAVIFLEFDILPYFKDKRQCGFGKILRGYLLFSVLQFIIFYVLQSNILIDVV
jgi:hypothetical protein